MLEEPAPLRKEQRCGSSGRQEPARGCHAWSGSRLLPPAAGSSPTWVFPQHGENQACRDGCFPREVCLPALMGCSGSSFPSVSGSHVRSTCFSSRTIANTQSYISSAFNEGITPQRTQYKIPVLLKMCQRFLHKFLVPTKVSGETSFNLLWLGWGPKMGSLQDNPEETCCFLNVEEIIYSACCDCQGKKKVKIFFLL